MAPFKQKVHKLRRLTAGDVSVLNNNGSGAQETQATPFYRAEQTEFYDILNTDIEEGRSNKLMQAVKTLAFQVAYSVPDIEAENLEPIPAAYLSAWAKDRLIRCGAVHQMRLSLVDYLCGGFGWAHICYRDGFPAVRMVDTMDVAYDLTATVPSDIKWGAVRIREPLWWWIENYGAKPFRDLFTKGDKPSQDKPVECWRYFDRIGEGAEYIVRCDSQDADPVYKGQTKYLDPHGQPYVPLESMFYFAMPGVHYPFSVVEMMLPAQIAHWEGMKRIRDTIATGAGWVEIEQGAYDKDQVQLINDGEVGILVERKQGKVSANRVPPAEIAQTDVQYVTQAEREMTEQSGANPYAGGTTVQNTKFAAEVNAVQAQAGLTAGVIAKDNARFWERVVTKMLWLGASYDDQPLTFTYDGARHEFDEADPIKDYLDTAADIVIQEDTMSFVPRQQKIAQSQNIIATVAPVAQMFPQMMSNALERFLRDNGIKNLTEWLQKGQAVDPSALAAVNTQ